MTASILIRPISSKKAIAFAPFEQEREMPNVLGGLESVTVPTS